MRIRSKLSLALLLVGSLGGCHDVEEPVASAKDTPAAAVSAAAAPITAPVAKAPSVHDRPGGLRWTAGLSRVYAMRWSSTTELSSLEERGGEARAEVRVEGRVRLTVVDALASGASVCVAVEAPSVVVEGSDGEYPKETSAGVAALLTEPACYRAQSSGRIEGMRLRPEVVAEPLAAGVIVSIIEALQITYPAVLADAWEGVEEDLTGVFPASYRWSEDALTRQKGAYTRLAGRRAEGSVVPTLRARYEIDAEGWPLTLRHDETTLFHLAEGEGATGPELRSRTRIDLQARSASPASGASLAGLLRGTRAYTFGEIAASLAKKQGDPRFDRASVGVDEALATLKRLPSLSEAEREGKRNVAAAQLARALRADRTAAGKALRFARGERGNEQAAVVIVSLLGAIGDAACQAELRDVLLHVDRYGENLSRLAIIHTGMIASAEAATIDAMRAVARSSEPANRTGALFALGRLAARAGDPAVASALVGELIERYRAALTQDERLALLGALGNARTARKEVVDLFLTAARSPDAELRARGVDSFSLVPGAAADEVIRAAMVEDRDPLVRLAAVRASYDRGFDAFIDAYRRALREDASADVRKAVIDHLGLRWKEAPAAKEMLEQVAAGDADEQLRAAARAALELAL